MHSVICLVAGLALATAAVAQAPEPYVWKNVQIVGGGFVTGIISHPVEPGLMYARTDVGGAYRWDNSSSRWAPITDWISGSDWTLTGIESLALDPTDPDRVYIAAGTYTNDWGGPGAMLRSSDRGATWQRTDIPFKNGGNQDGRANGERLVVDPNQPGVLLFGTRNVGLWRSDDHGATWSNVKSFPAIATSPAARAGEEPWIWPIGINNVVFDKSSGEPGKATPVVYATVSTLEMSVYRSGDAGRTWEAVAGQPTGLRPTQMKFDADRGALYITYGDTPGPSGMTRGAVWKLVTTSNQWIQITPLQPSDGDRFGYASVAVDQSRPGTLMVSTIDRWSRGDDIFRSTDGGATWRSVKDTAKRDWSAAPWLTWGRAEAGFGHWIGDVEIDPFNADHALYVTGTGIWATKNLTAVDRGETTHWYVGAVGIEECVVSDLISPPAGVHLLSTVGDIDGFRHEDFDRSPRDGFFRPAVGSNDGLDFAEQNPDLVVRVHGGRNTHGAYSLDQGRTWTPFATSAGGSGGGKVAVAADGQAWVQSVEGGAPAVTRDRGQTWQVCSGLPQRVRVMSDRVEPRRFYAYDGQAGVVYVSDDGAASFTAAATGLPTDGGQLRAAPGFGGHLWLASDGGLFRSIDGGASFTQVSGVERASRVGFGKAAPGRDEPAVFIVGHVRHAYGVYRSDDSGGTWVRINDDQHQYGHVHVVIGDPRVYGRVYLGSASRGVIVGEPAMSSTEPK